MTGLATVVEVTRADKSLDTLQVDTRLGNDSIFIAPQVHNLLKFSVRMLTPRSGRSGRAPVPPSLTTTIAEVSERLVALRALLPVIPQHA